MPVLPSPAVPALRFSRPCSCSCLPRVRSRSRAPAPASSRSRTLRSTRPPASALPTPASNYSGFAFCARFRGICVRVRCPGLPRRSVLLRRPARGAARIPVGRNVSRETSVRVGGGRRMGPASRPSAGDAGAIPFRPNAAAGAPSAGAPPTGAASPTSSRTGARVPNPDPWPP